MKKYEFTGDTKAFLGKTFQRIRALRDFGGVHAGDTGGWIESEKNLSHDGDAWVNGAAQVYGDARVYGDAWVYGDAQVNGDARVYGGKWGKSPCFIQGTRWGINISSPDTVRCGCQDHTFQEWHDHYAAIARMHGANDVLVEYILYFNLLCDRYGHEDCKIIMDECEIVSEEALRCT